MKKAKFSKKITLKKEVISKLQLDSIKGGWSENLTNLCKEPLNTDECYTSPNFC